MVLLLLGDSQVERVWPTVRLDRELLRDAIFFPVKNRASILSGFQSMTASVRHLFDSLVSPTSLELYLWIVRDVFLLNYVGEISFRHDCPVR